MSEKKRVSIRLTLEQQAELRALTGRAGGAIELDVEQLEERIAPEVIPKLNMLAPRVEATPWVTYK